MVTANRIAYSHFSFPFSELPFKEEHQLKALGIVCGYTENLDENWAHNHCMTLNTKHTVIELSSSVDIWGYVKRVRVLDSNLSTVIEVLL